MEGHSGTGSDQTSVDTVLRALADERRRQVLWQLRDTPDGVATYDEIAAYVIACSRGVDRDGLITRLVHGDLPLLADAGLVEYDTRSETVRYYPSPLAEAVLDCAEDQRPAVSP